jgi:hypothetical protein
MRRKWIFVLVFVGLLVVTEILLRTLWGFGSMVLFQYDPDFEYIAVADQHRVRFGSKNDYNEYSMRSKPLSRSDSCVVLGFGDSVLNGGTMVDQDSLATTIVEDQLHGLRFLNVSAGSWGPDNCAAYLKKYGDFNAKMIVLFVSSHDAHDNMTGENIVGENEAYPDHQYPLAMVEVVDKYIIPRVSAMISKGPAGDNLMINKNGEGFNTGFQTILDHAQQRGIPLLVCLHAERAEVEGNKFNAQGDEILDFCSRNNIKVITGLEVGEKPDFYRDDIHLNAKGQKAWVGVLSKEISSNLQSCLH